MEEIKLRGRPRKPRVGILSGDQVAALQTPQQIAERDRKDQDAARKREERARERVQREFGFIETMEALWAHNRELLTESESNLRVKDHQTRDLWNWIELVLEGSDISRDPDGPSKAEGISAVNAHVAEFGTCDAEIALIEQFWKLPLYENLKGGTETFAKFGLFISLPEIRVMQLKTAFVLLFCRRRTSSWKSLGPNFGSFIPTTLVGFNYSSECSIAYGRAKANRARTSMPAPTWDTSLSFISIS